MSGVAGLVALTTAAILAIGATGSPHAQPPPDASLPSAIRAHLDAGRYDRAELAARALVSTQDGTAVVRSAARDLLVEALVKNGRGAEPQTLALAQATVREREAASVEGDGPLALSARHLGDVLLDAGQYRQARSTYERAVGIRTRSAPGSVDAADDLDHLARALIWLEHYDEARSTIDQALSIKEAGLHASDGRLARTLEIRGLLWQRKGEYRPARADLERALAIRERSQPHHPEMAALLALLGEQCTFEGDLVQARAILTRAVAMARETLRPGHPDIAWTLGILAVPVGDLGYVAEARALREEALATAEAALGRDHPLVAVQLNDLAISLMQSGDYAGARRLQERALAAYETALGPDHSYVTTTVNNLAILNVEIGDVLEASRLMRRAITTWERVVGRDHPFVAFSLDGFGEALAQAGRHREALRHFERAVAIRERTLATSNPRLALSLGQLAFSLNRVGQVDRASALAARATGIWEQTGAPEGLSRALLVQAAIRFDHGDYAGAADAYGRALQLRLGLLGPSHPSIAEARAGLGSALAGLGRAIDAMGAALEAEDVGRDHLRLTLGYLPERQALGYASKRPKGLDLALSLVEHGDRDAVVDAVIRGRALILDEIASRRRMRAGTTGEALAPQWTALVAARQRLANLAVRGPSVSNPTQYATLLDEARRDRDAAERVLMERSAEFREEEARADIGLTKVQAALGPTTALVSFVRYDRTVFAAPAQASAAPAGRPPVAAPSRVRRVPSYMGFVLRPGSPGPIAVPLGRAAAIDDLVGRWRRAMIADIAGQADAGSRGESLASLGAALRRRVWDPVAVHLRDVTRAYLVPDGTLNLVAFAALPVDRGKYLLEAGPTLHYLTAERDLAVAENIESLGRGLLAVGNPAFADGSLFARLAGQPPAGRAAARDATAGPVPAPGSAAATYRGTGSSCLGFQALRFDALPASRREGEDVAALWRTLGAAPASGAEARVLTGRAAHEEAFKRLGPGHRVLHLATHGFFLGGECSSALDGSRGVGGLSTGVGRRPSRAVSAPESPLVLTGLVLAGANRRAAATADEDDGILTAEEVATLNLAGVEWAVLSACDTGLGELRAGEGVFGLRRAFQTAGVRTVIMSLWSVEDEATRAWMRALYTARLKQKADTADAVRQASLTVLRDRRARGLNTHPFYWAAFVAAGDWR